MKFKKHPLDNNAKKYIKEMLNVMKLDNKILKNIKLSQGEAYTFIPEKDAKPYLEDFRYGRLYPEDPENEERQYVYDNNGKKNGFFVAVANDAYIYLAKEVQKYINKDKNNICFLRKGYREKPAIDPNFVTHYFYSLAYDFLKKNLKLKKIAELVATLGFYESFGILTKKNDKMKFLESKETRISEEDMQFFIDNIKKIFVPAYDGEGFIIWDLKK